VVISKSIAAFLCLRILYGASTIQRSFFQRNLLDIQIRFGMGLPMSPNYDPIANETTQNGLIHPDSLGLTARDSHRDPWLRLRTPRLNQSNVKAAFPPLWVTTGVEHPNPPPSLCSFAAIPYSTPFGLIHFDSLGFALIQPLNTSAPNLKPCASPCHGLHSAKDPIITGHGLSRIFHFSFCTSAHCAPIAPPGLGCVNPPVHSPVSPVLL
jgi:hypothetical protein